MQISKETEKLQWPTKEQKHKAMFHKHKMKSQNHKFEPFREFEPGKRLCYILKFVSLQKGKRMKVC